MAAFDNKEKAEENKYAHDKEMEFLINARYHSLLAVWASAKMTLDAEKAMEYKNSLVTFHLGKSDDEALFHKIAHDLDAHHVHIKEREIREAMYNLLHAAKKQIIDNK